MRTLAPEGRLVVQEPDIRHAVVKLTALGEKLLMMRSRFRPPEAVRQMFETSGGQVSVQREGATFWTVVEKST